MKHPSRYARMLAAGEMPVADSELVAAEDRLVERIMLELRIADGLDIKLIPEERRPMLAVHRDRGHLDAAAHRGRAGGADPLRPAARRRGDPGPGALTS